MGRATLSSELTCSGSESTWSAITGTRSRRLRDAGAVIGAVTAEARGIRGWLRGGAGGALVALDLATLEALVAWEDVFRAALAVVALVEATMEWNNNIGNGFRYIILVKYSRGLTTWQI